MGYNQQATELAKLFCALKLWNVGRYEGLILKAPQWNECTKLKAFLQPARCFEGSVGKPRRITGSAGVTGP